MRYFSANNLDSMEVNHTPHYFRPEDNKETPEEPKEILAKNISIINGDKNPTWVSNNEDFGISFYQTKQTLENDPETYVAFVKNAVRQFRSRIRSYNNYKSHLINLGMDRCQLLGNITSDMASIEMHHNLLTIFDIAFIISKHVINTTGYINTFQLIKLMRKAHLENKVCLVMLSVTAHEQLHNSIRNSNEDDEALVMAPSMCFGDWFSFLQEYPYGISKQIAYKVIKYLDASAKIEEAGEFKFDLVKARDTIANWAVYNDMINKQPEPQANWVLNNNF